MADASRLHALTCPNCGAPLEFPKERSSLRCRFCDSVIERSDDEATEADLGHALKIDVQGGQISVSGAGSSNSASRRFIIKMRDGQPLVIEAGAAAAPPPPVSTLSSNRRASSGGLGCSAVIMALIVALVGLSVVMTSTGTKPLGQLFTSITGSRVVTSVTQVSSFSAALTQVPGLSDALTQVPGLSDALTQAPEAASTQYQVSGSAALVPALSDAPVDIVAAVTEYSLSGSDTSQHLIALSGAAPQIQWDSAPLDKDTYDVPIQASHDFVYTVTGMRLMALRRADGQAAWDVSLADKIEAHVCEDCLLLAEGRLFALTADGTLQALDAATGQPLWKYRAVQDSPRGLYLLGGRPAFMDRDDKGHGVLRAFDPASGKMSTVQPTCKTDFSQPDYADWTTRLNFSPDGQSAYLVFGLFRTCVARIDPATLKLVWTSQMPDKVKIDDANAAPVIATDAVFLGAGAQIARLGLADGAVQVFPAQKDYTLTPLTMAGRVLLTRAYRQRGTARYELWGVDPATGEQRWSYNFDQDPPLDVNSGIIDVDKPVWTWRMTSAGLTLLKFNRAADNKSHAVLLNTLNLDTGVSTGAQTIPLGVDTIILSAPKLLGWRKDTLWFVIENKVLALDTARGALVYRWP